MVGPFPLASQVARSQFHDQQASQGCALHRPVERALHGCTGALQLCAGEDANTLVGSRDASGFLLPSLRALQGLYGWAFDSQREGSRKQRQRLGESHMWSVPNRPPPAGEHREDAGCHPSAVCQVLPSALPAGRADGLYTDWPGRLLGEHGSRLEYGLRDSCLTLASLTLRRTRTQAPPIAWPISLDCVLSLPLPCTSVLFLSLDPIPAYA